MNSESKPTVKPLAKPGKSGASRRRFLVDMARTAVGVSMFGTGLAVYSNKAAPLPAQALRPPGALPEKDFLAACTRCGLCVRDCPYDILKLAELGEDVPTGTPYFTARTGPCEMCEDIPCVPVCPTGALTHDLTNIDDARMGLAVVVDQEACIAFLGLRCEVCFNVCPLAGDAISLDYQHNKRSGKHARFIPVVHSEACTGCGLCEKACILDKAAIKVFPKDLAQGLLGAHYRLGWEQKKGAGGSLVAPDVEHRFNLPEGMRYDYDGVGLIKDDAPPSGGAGSGNGPGTGARSALDVLNSGLRGGKP
jgi:ferredoxin-type protein NapG